MKNQIKIFEDFKNKFNKQNQEKKSQLQKLFLSGKYDFPKNEIKENKNTNKNKEDLILNINHKQQKEKEKEKEKEEIIELELSNGEKIKTNNSYIKKYPNSVLAAYINPENKFPKRNGKIFIDREPQNFKNLIYYLEQNKLPIFKSQSEEKKIFF